MFRKALFSLSAGIILLFLTGCGGASISVVFFSDFPIDQVETLTFQEVTPNVPSAISERRLVVIRDLTAWDTLWREHTAGISPSPPMPGINFSQNMVIGIFLGTHINACRDVEITSITRHTLPDRIEVNFREIASLIASICPSGNSNPAKLVMLPYSFLPVEFVQIG